MEESEEEQEQFEDDGIIAECGALHDTPMGEVAEEEAAQDEPTDDLGDAIWKAQRECDSAKEKIKFTT